LSVCLSVWVSASVRHAVRCFCVARRTYVQDGAQTWQEGVFCYEKMTCAKWE